MSAEQLALPRCKHDYGPPENCPLCKAESELSPAPCSDEAELRRMLAWAYSGHRLYCDDGELQDNREQPFIDFKRDAIAELKDKMEQRGLNRLHRELHQNEKLCESAGKPGARKE